PTPPNSATAPHLDKECALGFLFFFFFNDTATTEIYTLSLHDALPILGRSAVIALVTLPQYARDDRTDDCAFGADDVAPLGPKFRNLRFQMIADSCGRIRWPGCKRFCLSPISRYRERFR